MKHVIAYTPDQYRHLPEAEAPRVFMRRPSMIGRLTIRMMWRRAQRWQDNPKREAASQANNCRIVKFAYRHVCGWSGFRDDQGKLIPTQMERLGDVVPVPMTIELARALWEYSRHGLAEPICKEA